MSPRAERPARRGRSRRPAPQPAPRLEVTARGGARVDRAFLGRVAAAALREGGRDHAVSLLLTGEREIARIHARWLGDRHGTDVISFLLDDTIELVVSVERARREAARRGHAFEAELALYVIHGILHACGHDDLRARARARMRAAEKRVLESLALEVESPE